MGPPLLQNCAQASEHELGHRRGELLVGRGCAAYCERMEVELEMVMKSVWSRIPATALVMRRWMGRKEEKEGEGEWGEECVCPQKDGNWSMAASITPTRNLTPDALRRAIDVRDAMQRNEPIARVWYSDENK